MLTDGTVVYFEYDSDEPEYLKRAGTVNGKAFGTFKEHAPETVSAFHFNYTDGSFLFIDSNLTLHKLHLEIVVNTEPYFEFDGTNMWTAVLINITSGLSDSLLTALNLDSYEYKNLACFENVCLFSDYQYSTIAGHSKRGRVAVVVDDNLLQVVEGDST